MNKNLKKVIAREGLIFICIVAVGLIIAYSKYDVQLGGLGTAIFWIGYPFYLLIRFIIWAIKTLREK